MEQFPSKNPNPVFRLDKDGTVLYSNRAGEPLLQKWNVGVGEKLPSCIVDFVQRVISLNSPEKMEVKVGKRVYLITFHPLPEEYVNVYGFDISGQKELEEKLLIKGEQYDVLYRLGKLALASESLQTFMEESVKLVASALKLEYCKILELLPDGNFFLRAGVGWKPGSVGKAIIEGKMESLAGYTLFSKIPVIVENLREENRFSAPQILKEHGVVSGMSVVIGNGEKPFGVLGAHSTKKRRFTGEDTYFLNSVAFIIAEVIKRRSAEEELRQHREKLEELIKERTFELTKANEQLSREIAGRKQMEKTLQNNVNFLETVLNAIPAPIFYRNLDYIYQGCNEMFAMHILGLPKEKVVGHSMYEFKKEFSEEMTRISEYNDRMLLKEGVSLPHEVQIRCAEDGEVGNFLVHKATYSDVAGNVIGIVGVLLDITKRKKAEEALLKTENLRKKEIHHRIKNNLQVISSLLSLQAENFIDEKVKEAFQDSQNRVISMSLIHEELYKTGDSEALDFAAYLKKLATELFKSYKIGTEDIRLKLDLEKVSLKMDTAIPLGIIVSELVSNSLKHAFPMGRNGEIRVKLYRTENEDTSQFTLIVSDDGIGLSENTDFRNTSSLGLQLVIALVEQINGSIELEKEAGTGFRIRFKERLG
ncbi:MAG: histidine kinase dimerization/phosphoacceptor domain -containing protein [Methanosarcina sp.]|uniref:histidine kinase dimerization/phosphoacceptor domain -containing protein n=1 Tax=Methanosarcina sp. TaxID=2213 RepID=UPI0026355302|nr:histidine kinase dimerization/phosphoacceptor domain -containing protein [Methanosarcina sp.]MDD3245756.1 histidine kinase dimerization/phosphoacceptor domain -containing protein [Methanosarcina sp.]MDD4248288.1 histidine kinase dimerization/phosphoacceptor domain -containing protein [Methanosarcina sp.]